MMYRILGKFYAGCIKSMQQTTFPRYLSNQKVPPGYSWQSPVLTNDLLKDLQNLQMEAAKGQNMDTTMSDAAASSTANPDTGEVGGPKGKEPTRYGDWERNGRATDF
jgi:hypothetical protein